METFRRKQRTAEVAKAPGDTDVKASEVGRMNYYIVVFA